MKLKLDASGNVVVQDGKPVYVKDDGSEVAFDVVGTTNTIARLNGESKAHREAKEAAELRLQAFKDIDPEKAKTALETVKNLDDKKLVDAGEVERMKAEVKKAVEDQYKPIVEERDKLSGDLRNERIGGSFARSKYITDNIAIPADFLQSRFDKNFKVENGKIVATDNAGNKIYSPSNPGELAEFDEAIAILVNQYPHKDQILKGSSGSGGGAGGGQGSGNGGGKNSINRAAFDALDPSAKAAHISKGGVITD